MEEVLDKRESERKLTMQKYFESNKNRLLSNQEIIVLYISYILNYLCYYKFVGSENEYWSLAF